MKIPYNRLTLSLIAELLFVTIALTVDVRAQIKRHGLLSISPAGDSSVVMLAYVHSQLTDKISIWAIARDTLRPDSVELCFAAELESDFKGAAILNESGSDIPFPANLNAPFAQSVIDSVAFTSVRIPWLRFEAICAQNRFRISTPSRHYTFTSEAIDRLNQLRTMLLDPTIVRDAVEPPDFVDYEKEPIVIQKVDPRYPQEALRAGLQGNVYLKVWIDSYGSVKKVMVLKSDEPIFNKPAIDAAMQWRFTPALLKGQPVDVWVSIPFRFRLSQH